MEMANKKYENALSNAYDLLNMFDDLEPRSALKQCASDNGITEGSELQSFIFWAEEQIYGS
jgi:hypothetical protein